MIKKIVLLLIALFLVITIGCEKEDEQPEYDVYYIESHLDASNYETYKVDKTITTGKLLLLNEITTVTKEKDVYKIEKKTNKLTYIEEDTQYVETNEVKLMKTIENPIKLNLHDKYFSTITISQFHFLGNVYDEYAFDLLGIENINNIVIEISLNENMKVVNVKVSYVDIETEFNVKVNVDYIYEVN